MVADTIAHEMAHLWCGDLVTMSWWSDLWLNVCHPPVPFRPHHVAVTHPSLAGRMLLADCKSKRLAPQGVQVLGCRYLLTALDLQTASAQKLLWDGPRPHI